MSSRSRVWILASVTLLIVLGVAYAAKKKGYFKPWKPCPRSIWAAGVLVGKDLFDLHDPEGISNPVLTASEVTDRDALFVADTFIIPHGGRWYMFFEVMNRGSEQGDLGYASSADGLHWKYEKIIIDEPFHLSYPHVFEFNGEHYLIPESRQAQEIRLYKAQKFPTEWKLEKVLVQGNYADPSIVHYNGRWWIFAVKGTYNLAILSSPSLFGPWTEHPMTPIYPRDGSKTRPGGRMVVHNGKLVRFAQDSRGGYGHSLRAFVIDELTETTFLEHEAEKNPMLYPSGDGWKSQSMHQMDPWILPDGTWLAGIDGAGCPKPSKTESSNSSAQHDEHRPNSRFEEPEAAHS